MNRIKTIIIKQLLVIVFESLLCLTNVKVYAKCFIENEQINIKESSLSDSNDKIGLSSDSIIEIALLGDSMTWIGGEKCENKTGWSYYLKESFPKSHIISYARSGATWTNTANTRGDISHYSEILDDENVIFNQVKRLLNDINHKKINIPEIIIIYAGANDAWFREKRPYIFVNNKLNHINNLEDLCPSQALSLSAGIELSCRLLMNSCPDSRVVLVTPAEMSKCSPEITRTISDIINSTGDYLGIETFRTDSEVNIKHETEKFPPYKYTSDGVHTNSTGAKLIASFIISHLVNKKQ